MIKSIDTVVSATKNAFGLFTDALATFFLKLTDSLDPFFDVKLWAKYLLIWGPVGAAQQVANDILKNWISAIDELTTDLATIPTAVFTDLLAGDLEVPEAFKHRVFRADKILPAIAEWIAEDGTAIVSGSIDFLTGLKAIGYVLDALAEIVKKFPLLGILGGVVTGMVHAAKALFLCIGSIFVVLVLVRFLEAVRDGKWTDKLLGQGTPRERYQLSKDGKKAGSIYRRAPGGSAP